MNFGQFARLLSDKVARRPIAFASLCTTAKAAVCDIIAQQYVEQRKELDRTRVAAFAGFGWLYCGVMQYHIYSVAYPWGAALLKLRRGSEVLGSLAVDLTIHFPLIYYPVFYCVQDVVDACEARRSLDLVGVFSRWWKNMQDDMTACCAFWFPMNAVNFYTVPNHLRVPFIATAGFGWLVILSTMRGGGYKDLATETALPDLSTASQPLWLEELLATETALPDLSTASQALCLGACE